MLGAECQRCGRRSLLSADREKPAVPALTPPQAEVSLRCDLCGSRRVRIVPLASPLEAVAFVARRT